MIHKISYAFAGFLLLIFACSAIQSPEKTVSVKKDFDIDIKSLATRIDSIAAAVMPEQHIPGMAFTIVKDGQTILKNGYGTSDMYTGVQVDPDKTIFRIGSISKAVTLLALSKLIDDGRIGYEDDVTEYFPHVQNPNNYKEPLQIKHLLSHTTGLDQIGLDRHTWQLNLSLSERAKLRPSIDTFLQQHAIRRAPAGKRYVYDTYGTTLAGAIIEQVVGLPYKEAMKVVLFDPLGMTKSGVDLILEGHHHMARGHGFNDGAYQVVPYELYTTTPASSIDATAGDMAQLLEMLTSAKAGGGSNYLSRPMLERIFNQGYRPHPEFVGTSHGLHEGFYYGSDAAAYEVRSLAHGGDMYGYKAQFRILPEYNIGIFVCSNRNRESGGGQVRIERNIINAVLDAIGVEKRSTLHEVPEKSSKDLSEYVGDYFYGVHCHTCTEEQYEEGAWRPSWTKTITLSDGGLQFESYKYFQRDKDVFVKEDGLDLILFNRDEEGKVIMLQQEDDNSTFEKSYD